MTNPSAKERRGFFKRLLTLAGASAALPASSQAQQGGEFKFLPAYARAQNYKSLKQSSYDRTGGNSDRWPIKPGETLEVFNSDSPGVISHIWFTIAAPGNYHLKEIVLRIYWDGNAKPSVESPIGDFFGLNLADYVIYESAYLACSPGKSLNCYFSMPYKKSARITVTNEGKQAVGSFYSNIDYMNVANVPADAMYFHAQYRQAAPAKPSSMDWNNNGDANKLKNLDGKDNYVFTETRGRGHLMGVTLGVWQNQEFWFGEGDDMIFIDDETKPAITGTGLEDYFLGSWDWGGRDNSRAFSHMMYGAQFIQSAERTGGRYLCYRWHGDNPVTFNRYLKHTIEHGHANHRADNYYSCCYWYQSEPYTNFPALPAVDERTPRMKAVGGPGGVQPA